MISHLYDWDPAKEFLNKKKHGVSFQAVEDFDWETALVAEDSRGHYGEKRFVALGKIVHRVHVLVFTRRSSKVRIISLRKANAREVRRYEQS